MGGNPVSYTDPEGLLAWGIVFGGADLAWQLYQNGGNLALRGDRQLHSLAV
jgi:hypothetical protein